MKYSRVYFARQKRSRKFVRKLINSFFRRNFVRIVEQVAVNSRPFNVDLDTTESAQSKSTAPTTATARASKKLQLQKKQRHQSQRNAHRKNHVMLKCQKRQQHQMLKWFQQQQMLSKQLQPKLSQQRLRYQWLAISLSFTLNNKIKNEIKIIIIFHQRIISTILNKNAVN